MMIGITDDSEQYMLPERRRADVSKALPWHFVRVLQQYVTKLVWQRSRPNANTVERKKKMLTAIKYQAL